jgi:hypothetical protein
MKKLRLTLPMLAVPLLATLLMGGRGAGRNQQDDEEGAAPGRAAEKVSPGVKGESDE